MSKIIMYQKPTCTTCRLVKAVLENRAPGFEAVNYFETPFTKARLKELFTKLGTPASQLVRDKDEIFKELNLREKLKENKLTEDQVIELMVKHPDLIPRPLVEKGDKVILARPPEKIKEIL